jgi:hypothetical protein
MTGVIELLDRFRSVSTLSIVLSAFMAFPSSIPLVFPIESPEVSRESTVDARSSPTLVRKHDRISLPGWADSSNIADNAEESEDTPLPPAMLPQRFDLSFRIPSTIHRRGPGRSEVGKIGLRNPPLRC